MIIVYTCKKNREIEYPPSKTRETLGNALRTVILQNPEVIFCGYTLPHPAEDQMHLRIQTVAGVDAQDALLKGLQDLKAVTAHTKKVFSQSVADSKLN